MVKTTDYQYLCALNEVYTPETPGIATAEEVALIRDMLDLPLRTEVELNNIRDMATMMYSIQNQTMQGDTAAEKKAALTAMDKMSAITTVIDQESMRRAAHTASQPGDRTQFFIPIGDYAGDGHGEVETFQASAAKDFAAVQDAYSRIARETWVDLSSFCSVYDDDILPPGILQRLQDMDGTFELDIDGVWYDEDQDVYHITPEQMARIVVFLLNHVDPSLDVRIEDTPTIPHLISTGDKPIGYGLFSVRSL